MIKAPIMEIFSSLQGEGIYVGEQQIFIRFAGCNLDCSYCDTPASRSREGIPEKDVPEVLGEVRRIAAAHTQRSVSLTGGEPLLYEPYLSGLLPELKGLGLRTYLETNGTMPDTLKRLLTWIDVIAMDIKLFSDCHEDLWDVHRAFLKAGRGKIFVKIVLTARTTEDDVDGAVRMIVEIDKDIPLVLQPATAVAGVASAHPDTIIAWWQKARRQLSDARMIPQKHPEWNIR